MVIHGSNQSSPLFPKLVGISPVLADGLTTDVKFSEPVLKAPRVGHDRSLL